MVKEKHIKNLYESDRYLLEHSSLFDIDVPFKVKNSIPLIDRFIGEYAYFKQEINLLDVGGGSGIILKEISEYLIKTYGLKVNKYIIDLSPGMIKQQKKINSDVVMSLNEDICETSLNDNQIDITLMIDVLEHVTHPGEALRELRRISDFVIFKVPLEKNLSSKLFNVLTNGRFRRKLLENGHVNNYSFKKLEKQIINNYGEIICYYYTNIFAELIKRGKNSSNEKIRKEKMLLYVCADKLFKLSPKLSSLFFTDFVMILCKKA